MPLGFWPLPGFGAESDVKAAEDRFYQSYFAEFKGVWCKLVTDNLRVSIQPDLIQTFEDHGDHIIITRSKLDNGGGIIMLGRSDGVL